MNLEWCSVGTRYKENTLFGTLKSFWTITSKITIIGTNRSFSTLRVSPIH